jgi:hypothetical protein
VLIMGFYYAPHSVVCAYRGFLLCASQCCMCLSCVSIMRLTVLYVLIMCFYYSPHSVVCAYHVFLSCASQHYNNNSNSNSIFLFNMCYVYLVMLKLMSACCHILRCLQSIRQRFLQQHRQRSLHVLLSDFVFKLCILLFH